MKRGEKKIKCYQTSPNVKHIFDILVLFGSIKRFGRFSLIEFVRQCVYLRSTLNAIHKEQMNKEGKKRIYEERTIETRSTK